ncbi:MAG: hypothetical protein HY725_21100 [Candidatus Rokubacteria bacterium]|nr:hypothetical protein [Candidatus Rokubacteria bacterium]
MRIAVCLKQVPDAASTLVIDHATMRVVQAEPEPVYALNPPDRSALEVALRLVGRHGGTVTAVTLGPSESEAVLIQALARGADGAVHLVGREEPDAPAKAALLSQVLRDLAPDLILLGDRSQDAGDGQVSAWLAEALALPLVAGCVGVKVEGSVVVAERNLGRGYRQVVTCPLPAVVAVETGAADPCYVSVYARSRVSAGRVRRVAADLRGLGEDDATAVRVLGVGPRRIRPKRLPAPDPRLAAADRLQLALQGGVSERKGRLVSGTDSDVVKEIVAFLQEEGILTT